MIDLNILEKYLMFLVDYARGEMVQLVQTGIYSQGSNPSIIALSPKSDVAVIGSLNYLEIFEAHNGRLIMKIDNVFSGNFQECFFL